MLRYDRRSHGIQWRLGSRGGPSINALGAMFVGVVWRVLCGVVAHVKDGAFGLNDVLKMRPVTFKWKGRAENDLGLLAEDVEKINSAKAGRRVEAQKQRESAIVL